MTIDNRRRLSCLLRCPPDQENVGTDLFTFRDKLYLGTINYYSNFWEFDALTSALSKTVIVKLKVHFANYNSDIVFSDNGPQFSSEDFKLFATKWEFDNHASSPAYPQTNSKVESAMKSTKKFLLKAIISDIETSIPGTQKYSLAGLPDQSSTSINGWRTKTLLPAREDLLQLARRGQCREEITHNQRQQDFLKK